MPDITHGLDEHERKVLDLIDIDEIVALTQRLIAAPGENPPGGEGPTAAALAEACQDRGLHVTLDEVEPGRPNVRAVLSGGDEPGLLLLGHTDVVPAGGGWTVDPLGGLLRDGRIHGRGSADMLGGLAACVVAIDALRRSGIRLSGGVELAAVVDEEENGIGIRHEVSTRTAPEYAGCIVAEPTGLQTIIAARGDAYLQFEVTGRAAHSGHPADGRNAIYGATAVVADLERWHDQLAAAAHPLVGAPTWSVGQIAGGTGTSTVPAHCVITADRRLLPAESAAEVLAAVQERVAALRLDKRDLDVSVAMTMDMPGFQTPAEHPFVETVDGALGAAGGPRLELAGWTAACDGGFVSRDWGVPVVVLGPGSVTTQAHRADESVGVDELHTAARAYALAALRLLR